MKMPENLTPRTDRAFECDGADLTDHAELFCLRFDLSDFLVYARYETRGNSQARQIIDAVSTILNRAVELRNPEYGTGDTHLMGKIG